MTRAIKIRLLAFLVLSAVGIVYVAGSYLGIVDRVLGRGFTVHATLPGSGGLFVGSEATYRGVKVGKVSGMHVIASGVRVDVALEDGTRIPKSAAVYVHNLSAVGEQYLDFEPASKAGPYAAQGDTFAGDASSLPESTDDLITSMNGLVGSLDANELSTAVSELGTMFRGTADPLSRIVDSTTRLVAEAQASQQPTIDLLETGQTVLRTQQANADNIRGFARDLAAFTGSLKGSDRDLRVLLQGGKPALDEVRSLLTGLEPTLHLEHLLGGGRAGGVVRQAPGCLDAVKGVALQGDVEVARPQLADVGHLAALGAGHLARRGDLGGGVQQTVELRGRVARDVQVQATRRLCGEHQTQAVLAGL